MAVEDESDGITGHQKKTSAQHRVVVSSRLVLIFAAVPLVGFISGGSIGIILGDGVHLISREAIGGMLGAALGAAVGGAVACAISGRSPRPQRESWALLVAIGYGIPGRAQAARVGQWGASAFGIIASSIVCGTAIGVLSRLGFFDRPRRG